MRQEYLQANAHNAGAQACKHTCAMTSPLSCALAITPPAAAAPPTCCMRSCCCSPGCIPDRPPPIPADVCMPCTTFLCESFLPLLFLPPLSALARVAVSTRARAWPLPGTHAQQRPGGHRGAGTKPGQRGPDGAGAPGEDLSTEPRRSRTARSGSWLPVLRAEGNDQQDDAQKSGRAGEGSVRAREGRAPRRSQRARAVPPTAHPSLS